MKEKNFHISPSFLFPLFLLFITSPPWELLLFLGAVLLHECGHLFALRIFGIHPKSLALSYLGAGIGADTPYLPYKKEAWVFLSGPMAGAFGMLLGWLFLRYHFTKSGMLFFSFNLFLTLFNLFPVKGLDGGEALFSLLCHYGEVEGAEKIRDFIHISCSFLLLIASLWILYREKNVSLLIPTLSLSRKNPKKRKKATNGS